jgi:hypothetical protein
MNRATGAYSLATPRLHIECAAEYWDGDRAMKRLYRINLDTIEANRFANVERMQFVEGHP